MKRSLRLTILPIGSREEVTMIVECESATHAGVLYTIIKHAQVMGMRTIKDVVILDT